MRQGQTRMVQKIGAAVRFQAQPGQGDSLAGVLAAMGETVTRKAGTELWLVHRTPDAPDTIWLWEIFASAHAQDAHRSQPEYLQGLARIEALLDGPPLIEPVVPYAGKGLVAPPGGGRGPA